MTWIKENKIYVLISVLIIGALGGFYFFPLEKSATIDELESGWVVEEELTIGEEDSLEVMNNEKETIVVDVKGAIKVPGVYEVHEGERVIDVIEQAGGLLEEADEKKVNFAMKLTDEMVVYIPMIGEIDDVTALGDMSTGGKEEGKVNLNRASEAELQTLPGIGPSKADAIIEYRTTNGAFKRSEELMEISGIGEKTFEKLKDRVTVR